MATDFNELRDRAKRDVSFYAAVYNLSFATAHGYDQTIHVAHLLALLPGALKGFQNDGHIELTLKRHIVKRGGNVIAHGHKASSWCQWAADFRELGLSALRDAIFNVFEVSETKRLLVQLRNLGDRDILLALTTGDRSQKLQLLAQLASYLPNAAGMAHIDQQSLNVEIDTEILSAIEEANAAPNGAASTNETPPASQLVVTSEGDIPPDFRDGGLPEGAPLTVAITEMPEKYNLSGPYLSKNYKGPTIKWGRKLVYEHREIAALSDRKARREDIE
jgi:hypothetical protein